MKDFKPFTDKQLTELIERRSPHHPKRIGLQDVQALLDGRLVAKESASECRIIDCADLIEAMIQAGYHKHTMNPEGSYGMRASAYRKLWPKTVAQPPGYAGRFDQVLLVDRSLRLVDYLECGNIEIDGTDIASCHDIVSRPTHEGNVLLRYVAFFQDGWKYLNRPAQDCCMSFAEDEVGLVTVEGLHLPVQYKKTQCEYRSHLPGSHARPHEANVPFIGGFYDKYPDRISFGACVQGSDIGSASRGTIVIPVT